MKDVNPNVLNQYGLEYWLNEKQFTLDNYVQYLDTVCELAKI